MDAIDLGIMWDRLIAITNEITSALVRTSFSTNVRESHDLSCMVFDARGRSIAQGADSVPSFTGTAPATVRHMLDKFPPETLRPGDVIATNDPWMGTGHVYDVNVVRPIFLGDKLVAYTLSITHLPDIGGLGFTASAKSTYEEGVRLPVCKMVKGGVLNHELFELIATNVRVPDQTLGDLHANLSCTEVGGRLLLEFMEEYGIDDLQPLADAIVDSSETAMRERIGDIPEGVYEDRLQVEGLDAPITLCCRLTVKGGAIHAEFAGTSPAVDIGINVPLSYTKSFVCYAAKCVTVPNIPNNIGCVLPIEVSAPENCILNALPPYPTGGRHLVGHFVAPLVFGALARALPDRVQADCGMFGIFNLQGTHRDNLGVSSMYFASGGFGALEGTDGGATIPGPSQMTGTPVEVWENLTSTTIEKKMLLTDSGGAGRNRGGLGQEIVFKNDSGNDLTISFFGSRTDFPARGMMGAKSGATRRFGINGKPVHPRGRYSLAPDDVVTMVEAGGGGMGDPRERDPQKVLHDVVKGAVSIDAAARDYGVDVDPKAGIAKRLEPAPEPSPN